MLSVSPERSGYTPAASAALLDRLEDELAAIPGVSSVASSMVLCSRAAGFRRAAAVEGATNGVRHSPDSVSPDFFRTFGIELLAGREFNEPTHWRAVAIVNQRFAEHLGSPATSSGDASE